ncbi:MAG: uroporphyrinogen-III C-methyltransferase [Candidatus Omnitrophota bacterium]|nr:uroporphyrinogen-III C-methyltransferase [Candidatus Omnitrophota bacterium]
MPKSTVYLTGAGPGDAKLITVKGLELIKRADCIVYDYLVNAELLKFAQSDCKLIYVGKKSGAHTLPQDKINQLLVREARLYKVVVRLKGGDPFIFGRGAEEALYLKKHKIDFEIVPGVTSAIAVATYAGIPLTVRTQNSTVGFITGNEDPTKKDSDIDWEALSRSLGTMVFLMGIGNLEKIVGKLIESGKSPKTLVAIIRWGTTVKQKTVTGTLKNIVQLAKKNKIAPPAIIVVGEVVKFRKDLNWFEKRPLLGKRIVVTRTREQASALSEKLIDLGAEVIEIPVIKIVSLRVDKQLEEMFLQNEYDWVFFTSQNGVSEFAQFLNRAGKDSRIFDKAKVCAIGSETAKSLAAIGIRADYVPAQFCAEAVVEHFKGCYARPRFKHSRAGSSGHPGNSFMDFRLRGNDSKRALILRAKQARDVLPDGLKELDFEVKVIDLYDTLPEKESASKLRECLKQGVDLVTFASSSSIKNFVGLLGKDYRRLLKGVSLASIGSVTSATIREYGLKVNKEAKVYTIDGLVEVIRK